jgi:hypothetical protein
VRLWILFGCGGRCLGFRLHLLLMRGACRHRRRSSLAITHRADWPSDPNRKRDRRSNAPIVIYDIQLITLHNEPLSTTRPSLVARRSARAFAFPGSRGDGHSSVEFLVAVTTPARLCSERFSDSTVELNSSLHVLRGITCRLFWFSASEAAARIREGQAYVRGSGALLARADRFTA